MIPTLTAALWRIGEDGAPGFGGWRMVVSHSSTMRPWMNDSHLNRCAVAHR
jgi:hypothetical protein